MLPVPTVGQLAAFSGRDINTYGPFAAEALAQATLLFGLRTHLTALPTDPDLAKLATYAILQMADRIFLEQPNATVYASPYQSETIGSYAYSKGATLTKAQDGQKTGLFWWDLAMDQLTLAQYAAVASDVILVAGDGLYDDGEGHRYILSPADTEAEDRSETRIS